MILLGLLNIVLPWVYADHHGRPGRSSAGRLARRKLGHRGGDSGRGKGWTVWCFLSSILPNGRGWLPIAAAPTGGNASRPPATALATMAPLSRLPRADSEQEDRQ